MEQAAVSQWQLAGVHESRGDFYSRLAPFHISCKGALGSMAAAAASARDAHLLHPHFSMASIQGGYM